MKYLSTFEVAENGEFPTAVSVSSAMKTASPAHRGQVDVGLSPKMQRSPPMQESKAENISSQKQKIDANRKGGRRAWSANIYPATSESVCRI